MEALRDLVVAPPHSTPLNSSRRRNRCQRRAGTSRPLSPDSAMNILVMCLDRVVDGTLDLDTVLTAASRT
jgi:hypothetical protein